MSSNRPMVDAFFRQWDDTEKMWSEYERAGFRLGVRGGVAARFREVAFPMASVKEHQSRTETFARGSILCDASAPQRLARRPYCLGPTVDSDPSEAVDSTRCKSASMLHVGVGL